jgi:hypothetical protein
MPDRRPDEPQLTVEQFEPGKTYRCLTARSIFHCDHVTDGVAFGVGTPRTQSAGPRLHRVFHPVREPGEWVEAPEIPYVSEAEHGERWPND